jgi:predicted HTH domain antitoxin
MKVVVEIPDELRLKEDEVKMAALAKLYELGKISSGKAAKLLGISRVEFLDLLGKYKVQIGPDTEEELLRDIENA